MHDAANTERKPASYLFDVVWSILFQIYRPSDLEVGLTIQVGGLDEADLHMSKQNSHDGHHHHIVNTGQTAPSDRKQPGLLVFQLVPSDKHCIAFYQAVSKHRGASCAVILINTNMQH